MSGLFQLAYLGPGGPELLLVMLVLLLLFGAKDAPKVFRKITEFLNQLRSTADHFKREIMYSDLMHDAPSEIDDSYERYDGAEDDHHVEVTEEPGECDDRKD
ncbi:MAG TPA: hypothetical protein VIR63_07055 [Pontiella sp.]